MRRGLLVMLILFLLLSTVPLSADGSISGRSPSPGFWSSLLSFWPGGGAANRAVLSERDETLPVLDPDGLTARIPDDGEATGQIAKSDSGSDDGFTLPVLDPDG